MVTAATVSQLRPIRVHNFVVDVVVVVVSFSSKEKSQNF